ncbi:hypothetical protein L228DRAFT_281868 [Xylona heveae TC161]|uniref:Uncharacterized protein n=1 Tax=Xylona heveae (strain CBS 132557 / TC161) TaxID=1328760 RepID=A0A165H840_XYLHT|nr:hypothetical protein L228DRAFT_281868 [Xylona heveae TC161]KZF23115.1 hypothetical protein L228DRAFT_281868 [Xylona heveae TC161]
MLDPEVGRWDHTRSVRVLLQTRPVNPVIVNKGKFDYIIQRLKEVDPVSLKDLFKAIALQSRGGELRQPCDQCLQRSGHFAQCVAHPEITAGGCANCVSAKQAAKCSFRTSGNRLPAVPVAFGLAATSLPALPASQQPSTSIKNSTNGRGANSQGHSRNRSDSPKRSPLTARFRESRLFPPSAQVALDSGKSPARNADLALPFRKPMPGPGEHRRGSLTRNSTETQKMEREPPRSIPQGIRQHLRGAMHSLEGDALYTAWDQQNRADAEALRLESRFTAEFGADALSLLKEMWFAERRRAMQRKEHDHIPKN